MAHRISLPRPLQAPDFRGLVYVFVRYDDVKFKMSQAIGPVAFDCDFEKPQVIMQCMSNNLDAPLAAAWVYDFEANRGRGAWINYDEELDTIPTTPKPQPKPKAKPKAKAKPKVKPEPKPEPKQEVDLPENDDHDV